MAAKGGGDGGVGMTPDEKHRDQPLSAPGAVEGDAAPRIEVTRDDDSTLIGAASDAETRPGSAFEPVDGDR